MVSFFFPFFSLVFSSLFLLASFFFPFLSLYFEISAFSISKAHIDYAGSKMFQNPSKLQPPSFS